MNNKEIAEQRDVMGLMEAAELVGKVQNDINSMLIGLEKQIGRRIESAELSTIDLTTISDDRPRYIKSFQIKFEPTEYERRSCCY